MKALILAAGYATRMYPLTKEFPKPLLKVGHRPMIDYIVDKLQDIPEVDEILVVTNSKFISNFREWAKLCKSSKPISLVDDLTSTLDDRRGAIGDMDFAVQQSQLKDDLLVIGGDNLFDGSLGDFVSFAKSKNLCPAIGVYDIKSLETARKYGVVGVDADSRVIDFEEKPSEPKSSLVAMCLYYFPKEELGLIGEYLKSKTNKHDATGFYIDWLSKKISMYAYTFSGRWYDIGHRDFYDEANKKFA